MAGKLDLRPVLPLPYDRPGFIRDVLRPVFGPGRLTVYSSDQSTGAMTATDQRLALSAVQYGELTLDDGTEVRCLEVRLQPKVRPEQSRVGIQALVRRLLTAGQAALVNFVPATTEVGVRPWRFTLVAKDAVLRDGKVVEQTNNARRYTYLLGPGQACRTPADRLRQLATEANVTLDTLVKAFEVEVLSKEFFKEYKRHYGLFCEELTGSNFKKSVFNGDEKAIRDFVKKLLGRLVFLYFVQKKGWLGAGSPAYTDGDQGFITKLFQASGANATFYPVWLSRLFFETLNEERPGDLFTMPDGQKVCIPFLNGGLFDRDAHDAAKYQLTLPAGLFHQARHADDPAGRGFLDFLDSYNFTVQEDSPDEHVVAVDPEMLGNIFENLLEDNKDKGAFYTPKEIVHYMCRESLIEYLDTRLNQHDVQLGYDGTARGLAPAPAPKAPAGQLILTTTENRGNIQRRELEAFVREKVANDFIRQHAKQIDELLDTVKICDPAIGSGAFPMGLLHEIYLCKLVLKDLTPAQLGNLFHERDHLADPGSYHAGVKLGIIQNSIYGVDIERGAVDIARLRFWLSLVVDEDRPRPLPNLDYKIVVGNSLVSKLGNDTLTLNWNLKAGTEREIKLRQQYKALSTLQRQFFTKSGVKKQTLQAQIRDAKIDLLVAQVELEMAKLPPPQVTMFGGTARQQAADLAVRIVRQGHEALLKKLGGLRADASRALPYFDWRLDFPEVLNPHVTDEPGFDIVIGNPPYDVYEGDKKGEIEVLNSMPMYGKAKGGKLNAYKLFLALSQTLTKERTGIMCEIFQNSFLADSSAKTLRKFFLNEQRILRIDSFPERDNVQKRVFESAKMSVCILFSQNTTPNAHSFDLNIWHHRNRHEGEKLRLSPEIVCNLDAESATIPAVTEAELLLLKKVTHTDKVKFHSIAYCYQGEINLTVHKHLLYPTASNNSPMIKGAAVQKWHIKEKMSQGEIEYLNSKSYLASNKGGKSKHHSERRIVMQGITGVDEKYRLKSTVLEAGIFCGHSVNYIRITEPKTTINYVLGVLNSRLLNWFFKTTSTNSNVNGYEVNNLPFVSHSSLHKPIETLVTKILVAKAASATSDTTALEAEIDVLVYHLYGLKYDEVLLVEPGFRMSEAAYVAAGEAVAGVNNSAGA